MCKAVSYLGPEGSYSHCAAMAMCPGARLLPCRTFTEAAAALLDGDVDAAVLPIENTLNGGVMQNIDLLQKNAGLCAVRQYTLRIDHRLITLAGADRGKIKRIYSHRQALDQCSAFLGANYPHAELIAENSTAASISRIAGAEDAAIAGPHCVPAGYDVSDECISDEKNNYTHFLLVKKGALPDCRSSRIYFSVTCRHVPGALLKMLDVIYGCGLNMTKIESRPIKECPGEYRFFIEVEGDYSSPVSKQALKTVSGAALSFRLLGAY